MTRRGSAETTFGTISYRTAGSGDKAFVCIHGLGQTSLYWEHVIEHLPEGWQGYSLDLLGFGESARPKGGYSIDMHAESIAEVIASVMQMRVVLGANSLGGVVAMRLAIRSLAKLDGLFLTATGPKVGNPEGLRAYRDRLATMEITAETVRPIVTGFTHQKLPDDFVTRMADEMAKSQRVAMTETLSSSLTTNLEADLPRIKLPTLILQGAEDKGRTVDDGVVVSTGVADGRLVVLPRVGHTPMLEAPAEFQFWLNHTLEHWVPPETGSATRTGREP
jgi:pimeloyl-ACP methyl ester carboxylesterase